MSCATSERVRVLHRVKGRPALERSIRSLLIRVHRYSKARVTSRADIDWSIRMIAGLEALLFEQVSTRQVQATLHLREQVKDTFHLPDPEVIE